MKIAICIGVSEYVNHDNLPACVNDVSSMCDILQATGKYDELLCIKGKTSSKIVKDKLSTFISKHKGESVEEVFYYFSGHGDYSNEEFYYILSDFESSKRNSTTLVNTELDSLLRSLKPDLTIKVVDACFSGTQYIKGDEVLPKYLNSTSSSFKDLYFMYSSLNDQPSFQNRNLSYFTTSFLESLRDHKGSNIRYSDIISYMADDFESKKKQTPTFVTQASFTDVFALISAEVFEAANRYCLNLPKTSGVDDSEQGEGTNPVVSKVIREADKYCTKDELLERLASLRDAISSYSPEYNMESLYTTETSYMATSEEFDYLGGVSQWLDKNGHDYFVEILYKDTAFIETVPVDENNNEVSGVRAIVAQSLYGSGRTKQKKVWRTIPNSLQLTEDVPYQGMRIIACPVHENLKKRECVIAFVFSKTEFRFFYQFLTHKTRNWDETFPVYSDKWQSTTVLYKDPQPFLNIFLAILKDFSDYLFAKTKEDISFEEPSEIAQVEDEVAKPDKPLLLDETPEPKQAEKDSSKTKE